MVNPHRRFLRVNTQAQTPSTVITITSLACTFKPYILSGLLKLVSLLCRCHWLLAPYKECSLSFGFHPPLCVWFIQPSENNVCIFFSLFWMRIMRWGWVGRGEWDKGEGRGEREEGLREKGRGEGILWTRLRKTKSCQSKWSLSKKCIMKTSHWHTTFHMIRAAAATPDWVLIELPQGSEGRDSKGDQLG